MPNKLKRQGYSITDSAQNKRTTIIPVSNTGQTERSEELKPASTRTFQNNRQTTPEKKASLAEIANNSIFSGLSQFNKNLTSTLDFLLPTEFLGDYDFVSKVADYYSDQNDMYREKREDSVSDRSKFVQQGSELVSDTAAALPGATLALMTGGGSAAAQGGTAALTAASGAAQSGGMLANAANTVQSMMKNPMYWSSVGQTLGNNYQKTKENGASELQAIGSAFTSSLLNGAIEAGGGIETLPGVLKGGAGPATVWARSALTEGLEEPVQSTVSGLTEKLFFDRDKPFFSLTDSGAVINPGRMGQEFVTGTAVGGILGTGQLAGSRLYPSDPDVLAQRGDYSGYARELQEMIDRKKTAELMAEYKKHIENTPLTETPAAGTAKTHEFKNQTEYSQWLASAGAQDSELDTLEKYNAAKYNNASEYQLLSGYGRAVEKGDISPLVGFREYKQTGQLIQESVVGTRTPTGVQIESFAPHFIDRVIGQTSTSHAGMRCGAPVEYIVDALENPMSMDPIINMESGDIRQRIYGANASVVISLRDKRLISANPTGGH